MAQYERQNGEAVPEKGGLFPQKSEATPIRLSKGLLRFFKAKPLGAVSAVILVIIIVMAVFAEALSPHNPFERSSTRLLKPPSVTYPFGTDHEGRDILSRIIFGARISLEVGLIAVFLGVATGTLLGATSGYFGGWFDLAFQRLMDAIMSIPLLVMVVVIVAAVSPSLFNIMGALAFVIMPHSGRVVRGATLSVKETQYVEAAKAIGCSHARVLFRYILPNVMAPVIILATITLGSAIIAEASLSFLGLGAPPPFVSWGQMLSGDSRNWMEKAPWLAIFPGLFISLTVLAFNLLGDALRDVLDPRLRK